MKRHRTDLFSLFFGLFFLAVATLWVGTQYLHWRISWDVPHLGWVLAGGLILVGVIGVVGSLRGDRPADRPTPDDAATDQPDRTISEPTASPDDPATGDPVDATEIAPVSPPRS